MKATYAIDAVYDEEPVLTSNQIRLSPKDVFHNILQGGMANKVT